MSAVQLFTFTEHAGQNMSTQHRTQEVAVWTASILTDRSGKELNPWPGNKLL